MTSTSGRFAVLAVVVGLLVSSCSLRDLAGPRQLVIGTAARADVLEKDARYGAVLAQQFSMLVPENELKWDTTEPQEGVYDFRAADELVSFAKAHGMTPRGTPLVWYFQNPLWLTDTKWTANTLRSVLDDHIAKVVRHYKGAIKQWDVVNEAINDDGTLRSTVWSQTLGSSYIAEAYRDAHAADPKAELFYNDYNIEFPGAKSDAVFAMVSSLKRRGVPIDAVGFQMHALGGFPTGAQLAQQFARYAAIGVDVAITEMDVRIPLPVTTAELLSQAQTYHDAAAACLAASNCHTFVVWGFTDRYSWIPSFFPGYGAADLFDVNYDPKLAYKGLADALAGR
jgi:endo-1,4-beta-xylanase